MYQFFTPDGFRLNKRVSNSSRLVLVEAEKYGVKWEIIPGTQIVSLNYQGKTTSFFHQVPATTTALAKYACTFKKITSNLLHTAGVQVPQGFRIKKDYSESYLKEVYETLKKPLVVKPSNGYFGDNITVGINKYEDYKKALDLALSYSPQKAIAIVEEMFEGKEYRIIATQEKVLGILHRVPANITGDGKHTVAELIAKKNQEPIRAEDGTKSHLKIKIDKDLKANIAEQNIELETVIEKGKQIFLRKVSNVSKGGEAIDCTDLAHPSVHEIATKAVKAIPGLSFAGLDFITTDISSPQNDNSYVIIEVNDSPGFDIHDYPYEGKNRHVAREFLFLHFPELRDKRPQS